MSGAVKDSLRRLKGWVFQNQSRVRRIAAGEGTPGTRAAPAQTTTNDKKIGSRLDNGEKIVKEGKEYKRYKFQINKGADDSTLKELANKGSHKVWSQADIPIENGDAAEVVEQFFEDLEANMKEP